MNSTALSTKSVKLAVGALLAAVAFMALAFSASSAKASTAGDPIKPEFNYVGINVGTTVAGDINDIVYKPADGAPIAINGEYTDANGNFKVPKVGGLDFPPIAVDLDILIIDGKIGLTQDGTGHYDAATGKMSLDLSLSLELGVDDLEALSQEVGIPLGTGELACEFAPLSVSLGTDKNWPAPGKSFVDKDNFVDGALAGAWRSKPAVVAKVGDQSVCNIIGGFLKPVGGLWLANDPTESITGMPDTDEPPPPAETCEEHGLVGAFPLCEEPVCPEGQEGTPPDDCKDLAAKIGSVKVTKTTIKAGKKGKIKVTVKNIGTAAFKGKVTLKSNKKTVKVPKSVQVNIAPGKSVTKTINVTTTKKAKGKATITAKVGGKTGKNKVTVKAAKKKKRK